MVAAVFAFEFIFWFVSLYPIAVKQIYSMT